MSELVDRIAGLSAEKRRLLLERLSKPPAGASPPQLRRRGGDGPAPLSYAQERLWFLGLMAPMTAVYNVPLAFRVEGPLRADVLTWSLQQVLRRHQVLRARFGSDDGVPFQEIGDGAFTLEQEALCDLDLRERELQVERRIAEESRRPFDLVRGPMVRARLLRLDASLHVLMITLHHLVSDGWSLAVMLRELGVLYEAGLARRPSPLPELAFQYADFAAWQREWLRGGLQEDIGYWGEQLRDLPNLDLSLDHPRPRVETSRGGVCRFTLPDRLAAGLRALGSREGATLFMTLLAGFEVLLQRHAGQDDFGVGTPVAGRSRPELEDLIGFFVNTVVLRTRLAGDPTTAELLARTRDTCVAAFARQDLPFARLVELLRPKRDTSRAPLVQAMFVLQNLPMPRLGFGNLDLTPLEVDNGTAKFDLSLEFLELDGALRGRLEYNADLFEADTAARMVERLQTVLGAMVEDPASPISRLPLVGGAERRLVLRDWNATGREIEIATLHGLFEAAAERFPEKAAVEAGERTLTYRALNAEANRLAHVLRQAGVSAGDVVGVSLRRGVEMVVGTLGILKSGAAFLPLDPDWPEERLRFIVADSGARAVVAEHTATAPGEAFPVPVIPIDSPAPRASSGTLPAPSGAADLAYVIYTSGSTGRPKGVAIEHGSGAALFAWTRRFFSPEERRRVLCGASSSFDASVLELFTALISGGTAVIVDSVFEAGRVEATWMLAVPSTLGDLLSRGTPRGLRVLVFGGEALTAPAIRCAAAETGVRRMVNLYGPTEATVCATFAVVDGSEDPPPIGRPIDNVEVYVLDERLEPTPVGVVGELYIGGAGVGRGYVNRPGLTAASFLPDPHRPGGRLYRTGDLARHRPDGAILFEGRQDQQVKLRGLRIELDEIESVLLESGRVRAAVARVRPDTSGESALVAYVVPAEGCHGDLHELRGLLSRRLPSYMVPAYFVEIPALPLTRSGKLDQGALPAPAAARPAGERAAEGGLEQRVGLICEAILGAAPIDPRSDLFEMGMSSLLSVRLLTRIEQEFGSAPLLRDLFQNPTVAWLARQVDPDRAPADEDAGARWSR